MVAHGRAKLDGREAEVKPVNRLCLPRDLRREETTAMILTRTAGIILVAALAAISVQAEQHVLALDPQASKVTFTLKATGHMVEGGLALKSGRITFDPATGAASGEIAIDLGSAQTGNK